MGNQSTIPTARDALKQLNERITFTKTYLANLHKLRGEFLINLEQGANSIAAAASLLEGGQLGVSFLPSDDLSQESGLTGEEPQLSPEEDGFDDLDARIELTEMHLERMRDFRTERLISQHRRISPSDRRMADQMRADAGREQIANDQTLHGRSWSK